MIQNSGLIPHHSVLPRVEREYLLKHLSKKRDEAISSEVSESRQEDDDNPILECEAFDELMEAYHGPIDGIGRNDDFEHEEPIHHSTLQAEREWDTINEQARVPLFKDSKCSK